MKTITDLNHKIWYRLLKVLYILLFTVSFVGYPVAIFIHYEPTFNNNNSYVKCNNGGSTFSFVEIKKKFSEGEYRDYYFGIGNKYDKDDINKICNSVYGGSVFIENEPRNWTKTLGYILFSLLVITTVFEFIRRVFYYIVLGKIRPNK